MEHAVGGNGIAVGKIEGAFNRNDGKGGAVYINNLKAACLGCIGGIQQNQRCRIPAAIGKLREENGGDIEGLSYSRKSLLLI